MKKKVTKLKYKNLDKSCKGYYYRNIFNNFYDGQDHFITINCNILNKFKNGKYNGINIEIDK